MKDFISNGNAILGIELGSTRIKAVLIGPDNSPIAQGGFTWENSLIEGNWTYSLDQVWKGISIAYKELKKEVHEKYGIELTTLKALGISAMMHGYLVFDSNDKLLTPFRTWRNVNASEAASKLTDLLEYQIPDRWSIAHLYQSFIENKTHVKDISFMTTLSGYVHWKLTGEKVLGIGDASGMFPIDIETKDFDDNKISTFNNLLKNDSFNFKLKKVLPKVLVAGQNAGTLSKEGSLLLDSDGSLNPGCPLCPPEGDAATGMVATNSIAKRAGNVSAGTSVFAMVVLEKNLSKVYKELDLVTTPCGDLVAMAHANNCTGEYDSWVNLFKEVLSLTGNSIKTSDFYDLLLNKALEEDKDCGGLISYNYISGESMTQIDSGRPLFVKSSNSNFNLSNFMRVQLYSSLATLRIGMDILVKKEKVTIDLIKGHGGFFKTENVGQRVMSAALGLPVSTLETASEGGSWGIALLAAYITQSKKQTLEDFLNNEIFKDSQSSVINATDEEKDGYNSFFDKYLKGLEIERAAVNTLK